MNRWERFVGVLGAAASIGSVLVALVGVDMFGLLEPFALFLAGFGLFLGGLFIGWFARAWREQRGIGDLRRRYDALDGARKQLLKDMYDYGFSEYYWESEESRLCEGMSHMGFTELAEGGVSYKWRLTGRCRKMMDKMRGL